MPSRSLALAFAIAAGSCAITEQTYQRDGREYGVIEGAFRGRWYNYYERGLSFLEGGYHEEAARDFRAAIELRGRDQRRARTYGLHFIDYFPNRELGIALLAGGDIAGALAALGTSLSHVDSGRAEYFLNEAQRAGERFITGGVWDSAGVATLLAGGTAVRLDSGSFTVAAPGGPITLRAEDRAGNIATVEVDPEALARLRESEDAAPPAIRFDPPPAVVYSDHVYIDGSVSDYSGVAAVSIAGTVEEGGGKRTLYCRRAVAPSRSRRGGTASPSRPWTPRYVSGSWW